MSKNLLIVDRATNLVVNKTIAWEPPEGCVAIENDEAQIGWSYDPETGNFLPPVNDDQSVATSGL